MIGQDEKRMEFISVTTHELKTSLTAIIASAELLSDELQLDKKSVSGRLIQSIIRNAHRINEMLSSLSERTWFLTREPPLQPESVEVGQVIHNVAARLYPTIQSRRQSLTLELTDSLPLVKVDRQYLEQVLLTLIANANKFTPEGGKIKVSAGQHDDNLVIQVSDTGVGIPAKEQERIFQPYYQVNRNRDGKPGEGGLGLAIAKLFIELHDGKIWVESTVGQGSSFFFSLPLTK